MCLKIRFVGKMTLTLTEKFEKFSKIVPFHPKLLFLVKIIFHFFAYKCISQSPLKFGDAKFLSSILCTSSIPTNLMNQMIRI